MTRIRFREKSVSAQCELRKDVKKLFMLHNVKTTAWTEVSVAQPVSVLAQRNDLRASHQCDRSDFSLNTVIP